MGYTTRFDGILEFTSELTNIELGFISSFFGKDIREHPEWINKTGKELYYIDFILSPNFNGIQWDGSEKTYNAEHIVNFLILNIRKRIPDFGLKGKLLAQGEDIEDRWWLLINKEGWAERKEIAIEGDIYKCPHCEEKVIIAEAEKIQ